MRIISGKHRGRILRSLDGENTRPTTDRVKESLFDIIQTRIQDSDVLDLFAGSGALGIECLSRGANSVVFCDNNKEAVDVINRNYFHRRTVQKPACHGRAQHHQRLSHIER